MRGEPPVRAELVVPLKYLGPVVRAVDAEAHEGTAHAARDGALTARRVVDVGVIELLRREAGEVIDAAAGGPPVAEGVAGVAPDLVGVGCGDGGGAFRRLVLFQLVHPREALRARAEHIPVLAAVAVAALGVPVVHEGGVVASPHGPEELVAEREAAIRRGPVHRHQEAGGAVLAVDRVVEHGEVEDRDALGLQQRVGEVGVMIEIQDDRPRGHLPPGRGLEARREATSADLVFLVADLLDLIAIEVHVTVLATQHVALRLRGDHRGSGRAEERAEAGLGVEIGPVGRDPAISLREDDVAGGHHAVAVGPRLDFVGEELHVAALRLHGARQLHVVLAQLFDLPLLGLVESGLLLGPCQNGAEHERGDQDGGNLKSAEKSRRERHWLSGFRPAGFIRTLRTGQEYHVALLTVPGQVRL